MRFWGEAVLAWWISVFEVALKTYLTRFFVHTLVCLRMPFLGACLVYRYCFLAENVSTVNVLSHASLTLCSWFIGLFRGETKCRRFLQPMIRVKETCSV